MTMAWRYFFWDTATASESFCLGAFVLFGLWECVTFSGGGGFGGNLKGIFQGYVGKIMETGDTPPKFNSEFTLGKMVGEEDKPFL